MTASNAVAACGRMTGPLRKLIEMGSKETTINIDDYDDIAGFLSIRPNQRYGNYRLDRGQLVYECLGRITLRRMGG